MLHHVLLGEALSSKAGDFAGGLAIAGDVVSVEGRVEDEGEKAGRSVSGLYAGGGGGGGGDGDSRDGAAAVAESAFMLLEGTGVAVALVRADASLA